MSFAAGLALLVGLLVAGPLTAHLLRRGRTREEEFPPAHLVPAAVITSDQRRRLEDRALLSVRALIVLCLAILGATPLVRCSRITVDRERGASVALAVVLDDSHSMQSTVDGRPRFELARKGLEQLLDGAREGDAVALILAGRPPRLLLSPTTELHLARKLAAEVKVTDRSTDLAQALALAHSSLQDLPHVDKRIVLFSDLEGEALNPPDTPVWAPLTSLSQQSANCGIARAERQGQSVVVLVGCNHSSAANGRQVELHPRQGEDGPPLATLPLQALPGQQKILLKHDSLGFEVEVRLSGSDQLPSDDRALVTKDAATETIAIVADPTKAATITGSVTVVEQALSALFPESKVRPLASFPEAADDLSPFTALVVDDPPGLSPEARAALGTWLEGGGVALGLLGPTSATAELAASLEPFARKGAPWEAGVRKTISATSIAWLGPASTSLASLEMPTSAAGGRIRLDGADLPETRIVGEWSDGVPWLFERQVGRGLVFTAGLPASVELSDFALRPGFLGLLDHVINEARSRTGGESALVGAVWSFPESPKLTIEGPRAETRSELLERGTAVEQVVTAEYAGVYELSAAGRRLTRTATLDPNELTATPAPLAQSGVTGAPAGANSEIDASPEWAILILVLFFLELCLRAFGEKIRQRFGAV